MIIDRTKTSVLALVAVLLLLACAGSAHAAAPVKLVLSSHLGSEVDKTTKGNVCTIASEDECQEGGISSKPGGFESPEDVTGGTANGHVYVADRGNSRVQELTATGEFVAMFGKKVNDKGGNICLEVEESECKAGEEDGSAQSLGGPQSIAVDPSTERLYVLDRINWRVDEYTLAGQFVLMIGKEVNAKGGNVCTAAEESECKAGVQSSTESTEIGAFNFAGVRGDLLAVGPAPERLLYVGDEHRVQEFNDAGESKGEIKISPAVIASSPSSQITGLAVNEATEMVYVVYGLEPVVRVYDPSSGLETETDINITPREAGQTVEVPAIAMDPSGHLAVWGYEGDPSLTFLKREFGSLYESSDGRLLTRFSTPDFLVPEISRIEAGVQGIGFNSDGELYAAFGNKGEVWSYTPELVAELTTRNETCGAEGSIETSDTFGCTLNGEVNPYDIPNTKVWFEWGDQKNGGCPLDSETGAEAVATVEAAIQTIAQIRGLRPNAGFCYRVAGTDQHSELPEKLAGNIVFAKTPLAAPRTSGQPNASFVTSSSVLTRGELNPENAVTEYFFEYSAGNQNLGEICPKGVLSESCLGVFTSATLESEAYGRVGVTLEARGLRPSTVYHYRLVAKNEAAEVFSTEGIPFETAPAAKVEATTGAVSSITATTAAITGTVNPDGKQATYAFELGAYLGPGTQYGVVTTGTTGRGTVAESESVVLTGLQPATIYAFRIVIHSGYGAAVGAPIIFTTAGLPSVLEVPHEVMLLSVPPISFPKEKKIITPAKPKCKRGYARDKHGQCVKTKPKKTKKVRSSSHARPSRSQAGAQGNAQ